MRIGFFNYYEEYNNRMFEDASSPIGDDLMYPMVYLAEFARARDISISTIDTEPLESYDAIVFMEFPTLDNSYFRQLIKTNNFDRLYVLTAECKIIKPDNFDRKNHKYFKKVFTYDDTLVDNKKYFKINYSFKIPVDLKFDLKKKSKLCTLIAGQHFSSHPLELYSERVKAISWFEHNYPEDFDLYGIGWDVYRFRGILKYLNSFTHRAFCKMGRFFPDKSHFRALFNYMDEFNLVYKLRYGNKIQYPSYKGRVKSKRETYENYKFAICYENARDISGWITEKIFDCFFAGCVPVYWGAPNVTDHIPADTFIDKRNFNSYEELYSYLKNMTDNEYIGYLDAIKKFIKSDKIYPFSAECFAETIINEIAGIKD